MTNLQPNLWNENLSVGPETKEIAALVEKYPAVLQNRGLFFWFFIRERCPFLAQLPENQRNELKDALNSLENARRRLQDYKSSIPQ